MTKKQNQINKCFYFTSSNFVYPRTSKKRMEEIFSSGLHIKHINDVHFGTLTNKGIRKMKKIIDYCKKYPDRVIYV